MEVLFHIHAQSLPTAMSRIPDTQFQLTHPVSILRTDQDRVMDVYHTNSACSTYQHYKDELPAVGYPFAGSLGECVFCQRLHESED